MAAFFFWLPSAQATDITGSGSTFVHPIMLKWAASYNAKTDAKVSYQGIGSGGGIQQVESPRESRRLQLKRMEP